MITHVPLEEWIIDIQPPSLKEAERILREAGYIVDPKHANSVKIGTSRFTTFSAVSAAVSTIAAAFLLVALVKAIESFETPRQRRRRRTQLCVLPLIEILQAAEEEILAGYYHNRALDTNDEEKRHARRFKSRA